MKYYLKQVGVPDEQSYACSKSNVRFLINELRAYNILCIFENGYGNPKVLAFNTDEPRDEVLRYQNFSGDKIYQVFERLTNSD